MDERIEINTRAFPAHIQPHTRKVVKALHHKRLIQIILHRIRQRRFITLIQISGPVVKRVDEHKIHQRLFLFAKAFRRVEPRAGKLLDRHGEHLNSASVFRICRLLQPKIDSCGQNKRQQHAYARTPEPLCKRQQNDHPGRRRIRHVVSHQAHQHASRQPKRASSGVHAAEHIFFHTQREEQRKERRKQSVLRAVGSKRHMRRIQPEEQCG